MFPELLTKRKKEVKVDSLTAQVSTFLHRVHINVSDYTRENMLITDIVRIMLRGHIQGVPAILSRPESGFLI